MALRISLVTAPVGLAERYGRFRGAANTEPSFALVLLGAVARRAGHQVQCVEASAFNLTTAETLRRILAFGPDIVGITATTVGIHAAGELAASLRAAAPGVHVIAGGCHVTAIPEETLDEFPALDLLVVGEGEQTFSELLSFVDTNHRLPPDLAGTVIRDKGTARRNPPRPVIRDLDSLPLPAWDMLDGFPSAFRPSPARIRRWPCASVVLTRGCPNQCVFCDRSVFGNHCRSYSAAYAVNLIRELRDKYGVREILIEDDTFVLQRAHVQEFCERLLAEKIDVTWSCLGRADRVTPELLALMKRAGCWHIGFGIESGDPEILKAVHKNLDLEQVRQAVTWCRNAGIETKGFFIVGFPGETPASMEATRLFALSLPLDDISVMQMTPFPGSALYSMAGKAGQFDTDWRKMNALNTVFVPTGLTAGQLEAARARMIRTFYFRPGIMLGHLRRALTHPRTALGFLQSLPALLRSAFGR